MNDEARFSVGQVVHHRILNYRGVVVDVDPNFQSSELWYNLMTVSKPPKDKPWYHVLVDNSDFMTYVSEQNLEVDADPTPIHHPDLNVFFGELKNGIYASKRVTN